MIAVANISLVVWLHHFFTMGAGANVNSAFGVATILISIPTSALVISWIATMYKGRVRFKSPMIWLMGFMTVFGIGGVTGVLLGIPPVDFQLHNSLFLVAHFHSTAVGGVLFGIFAALSYWFPKMFGFRLNERLGRYAAWTWIVGFFVAFTPLYILGLMGATRRLNTYDPSSGYQPFFIMALIGGLIITAGVVLQIIQIIASIMQRKQLADTTGDPWDARSLEWSLPSPPQPYNFATIPEVHDRDAFWEMKQNGRPNIPQQDVHMPKSTAAGIYISAFAFLIGFGFVWEIIWMVAVGVVGVIAVFVAKGFNDHPEYTLSAAEVTQMEVERAKQTEEAKTYASDDAEDMGLVEFIRTAPGWLFSQMRNK
jgi:cytochrome o ubiquinol oxidase subunit 1